MKEYIITIQERKTFYIRMTAKNSRDAILNAEKTFLNNASASIGKVEVAVTDITEVE